MRQTAALTKLVETVICPPAVFITACQPKNPVDNFNMGAQSLSIEEQGPFTGQISASMLKSLGVKYVITGHSEERAGGETDTMVSRKIKNALNAGIIPVVCVGEKNRDSENGSHYEYIKQQMKQTLAEVPAKSAKDIVLVYEPVWAIGAKEAMDPAQIHEMALFVKKIFADTFGTDLVKKIKVLYGGSVNFRNATDIIQTGQVDGLLVGRESVNVAGFTELLKVVDEIV